MIYSIDTPTVSEHAATTATTTMSTVPVSDASVGVAGTTTSRSQGSFSGCTLCLPEIFVISGAGNEIDEVVSDDEQPVLAETSQDRHRRERANCIRNIRRRHILGNKDPTLPVSIDEVTRASEDEQEVQSHQRRNQTRQRRRDWQAAQAKRQRGAAIPAHNLLKEFEGVMETPSQAGGKLVKLCELLPNNEDGVAIKTVLARAADHLVPRQQEVADARQIIDGNCDTCHSIE